MSFLFSRRSMLPLPVLALVILALGAAAAGTGHIQVKCDPGVQIFLGGDLKGVTSADVGGLILQNIPPGNHRIRAVRAGFQPQEETVAVVAGQVVSFTVKPFVPQVKISQAGDEAGTEVKLRTGSLLVQSLPIECSISIDSIGISNQRKTRDRWRADAVPVGTYAIVAEALGKRLSHETEVREGAVAEVFFNFIEGTVREAPRATEPAPVATVGGENAPAGRDGPVAGKNATVDGLGLELVWVAPGSFRMGTPSGGDNDERPVREVRISRGFWLGKYEVTQAEYEALMGTNPSRFKGARNPVESVSWPNAVEFCRRLTERERAAGRLPDGYEYRLPTEAEWEYAARGGAQSRGFTYAGSNNIEEVAWYTSNSGGKTHPVGGKKPNELGLYDMSGNVWEWCHDWYQSSYSGLSGTDPAGPGRGSRPLRVFRGGSWNFIAGYCRSAFRSGIDPSNSNLNLGFRVALAAPVR